MEPIEFPKIENYKFKQEGISKSHPLGPSAPTHVHTLTQFPVCPSDKLSFVVVSGERGPKSKQVELKGGI